MKRELKVMEFNKKQKLLDFVNANSEKLDIVSISGALYGSLLGLYFYDVR